MKSSHALQVHRKALKLLMEERKRQGISHEKLAAKAGINRSTISLLENGRRNPTLLLCLKLAEALEVTLSDILKSSEYIDK